MLLKKTFLIAFLAMFAGSALVAQNFKYIGAAKCKMCHNKPDKGEQYNKWSEGPHANAMKVLSTDQAKEIASAKGVDDPATSAACVKCHSTFGGAESNMVAGITMEEGVSCESCHGPGSRYKGAAIMKDMELAMENGLIMPTEELCKKCHNQESPTFKGFDFAAAKAKIAHPDPTK